jgi:hypothetical protein
MNDAYGDPRNFDPNDTYWDENDYDATWGEPAPPPWGAPQIPIGEPPRTPPATVPPPNTTPPPATGGKTRDQIEAEGREYDRQHGYIGGYYDEQRGVWVNGSPTTTTPNPRGYTPPDGEALDFGAAGDEPAFNWSQFNPQALAFSDYVPRFGPFAQPTREEAENEPGYQFARDQGRKTLENSAAGRGVLRTGGTLKDILEYGDKFGEQNYDNVFNRKYQTWQGNNAWDRDNYVTNRDTAFGTYDRNYRGQKDSFDAVHDTESRQFADNYQRWRDKLNSLTQIATAGANG